MRSTAALKSLKVFNFDYAYLDSEAPPSSNYTTWVLIHGMGFNGAVMEKLLPLAHEHNLRIVSLYRRGYAPSSGFEEHELTGLGFGKKFEDAEAFYRAQGIEIATFLANFATSQNIPLADPSSPSGGIAVIGWSLAVIHATAMLAYLDELSEETRSTLQKYLHTVLSHDTSAVALGMPNTDRHDISLWFKPDDRERLDAFFDWATGHYMHKSVASENIDDLEFNNASDVTPPSMCELSYEQRAEYTELGPFGYSGCDGRLLFCDVTAFAMLNKRALFDKVRAEVFPVRVRFMSSGTTAGVLVWALWMLRKHVEDPAKAELYGSDAKKARDIKIINQTEGNHFIFWENPEKAIQQYNVAINM